MSSPQISTTAFPRQKCRGLIEAARASASTKAVVANFRGRNAAASLKQLRDIFAVEIDNHFRGRNAAASLKRQRVVVGGWCSGDFRGRNAAASLKHLRPSFWVHRISLISAAEMPRPH